MRMQHPRSEGHNAHRDKNHGDELRVSTRKHCFNRSQLYHILDGSQSLRSGTQNCGSSRTRFVVIFRFDSARMPGLRSDYSNQTA